MRASVLPLCLALAGCLEQGLVLRDREQPESAITRADQLAAGPYHSCALRSGELRCWGANESGQLGLGDTTDRTLPEAVAGSDWVEIVAGEQHSCARRTAGSLWCWGENDQGQLGVGFGPPSPLPVFVSTQAPVVQLAATYHHTCAIDDAGALFCWGANEEGQLAQDDPFTGEGVDRPTPVRVGTGNEWLVADAGQGHTCAIESPGKLHCWGRNLRGELGLGPGSPGQIRTPQLVAGPADWRDVRIGQNSSCGLRQDDTLHCWGGNDFGEQGHGDTTLREVPTQVGSDADWATISTDTFHTCGIKRGGTLHCWGRNFEGQLALGDTQDRFVPTQVGADADWEQVAAGRFHTCATKRDGRVYCAGQNDRGQLGLGDLETRLTLTPVLAP